MNALAPEARDALAVWRERQLAVYQEGRDAHCRQDGLAVNPHPEGSLERSAWNAGWCHRNEECFVRGRLDWINPGGEAADDSCQMPDVNPPAPSDN